MKAQDTFTKEELESYYKEHTYGETLKHFNISGGVLDRRLKKYGINKPKVQKVLQEQISKERLEELYIQQNYSMDELCKWFNITGPQLRQLINCYGITKSRELQLEVTKRSNLQKYGVESTNSSEAVKEHKRQVWMEKHGVPNPGLIPKNLEASKVRLTSPEFKQKRLEALLARTPEERRESAEKANQTKRELYGEDCFKQFAERTKQGYLEKYGVPYLPKAREKMKQTCLERYGTEQYSLSEEGKERIRRTKTERYGGSFNLEAARKTKTSRYGDPNYNNREKTRKTNRKRYGVDWFCIHERCMEGYKSADSKPNLKFAAFLESYNIQDYEREFPIANRSYDFKIGTKLIEINPSATHNSTWGIFGSKPKDPTYHLEKTKLARENGYQCIHVFDWDDWDKVIQLLEPRQTLYARKLKLKEISQLEANRFLKQYHLQGGAKLQTICYGLFLDRELIEVMTFGKPRFNKNYRWELIRLCTKAGYCVVGGAERMFKAFIRKEQPESIISYCDDAKFTGNVYTRLGFKHQSTGAISKHWYNPETRVHITDNGLRMRGFDKLLGETYGQTYGKGTSNEDLMREHGFVEVYDAGQSVYVWNSGSIRELKGDSIKR